ncbi:tetratricopeptide repeat-containing diguanylate cyclase [Ureibacillus acetophenoni]|uniref:Diguanylate cyclase (GGDEF)-like protein n=1 Tax=Ureibacillus acetophenoni TaxID=614649 RepID=A0A285UN68_9BACL|nr:tetratricopeptide repeat-containing diguanylate cyclase [Ureibacillus acetophenoni]SOC43223.1 diguanylate cyclase (GGDEF)-like protein [Ureibacillus acetophenoni]
MKLEELKLLQQRVTSLRAEGKYKDAIESSQELLKLGLAFNDFKSVLIAHLNKAASFYCIGDIEAAFHSIDAYSEVCLQYGDDVDWLSFYNVRFLLYEFQKDYKKAEETLHRTIELGEKTLKYNIVSNAYSNLSHLYIVDENFDQALEMAKLGLEMAKLHQPKSEILEIRVVLNMAKAYIGLHKFVESRRIMDEIIRTNILDSFIREKSQYFHLLGLWHTKLELFEDAFNAYTISKQLVESYNDLYLLKNIQEERMKLCELMKDIQKGYIVQKEYIKLLEDINEREVALTALKLEVKHSLRTIEKKANTDFLTGVYNRNYLESKVSELLNNVTNKQENIVCILFDIDDFKLYNDEHGHLFGDEVIKLVSKTCEGLMQKDEMIGRFGGDEFVIITKGRSLEEGKNKAIQIAEAIRNLEIKSSGKSYSITISMGVADNQKGKITSFQELFHLADMALYEAKKRGKDQIYVNSQSKI